MNRLLLVFTLAYLLVVPSASQAQARNPFIVSQVEWSGDGSQLLVALEEGGLYVVDLYTQAVLMDIPSSVTGRISDAAMQPGGSLIATVDNVNTLTLWDLATEHRVDRITVSETATCCARRVTWSPDGQYLFTSNVNDMFVRDAAGSPLFPISFGVEDIPNVAFSPDGTRLLLSFSAKIEVWDVASQQMLARNLAAGLRGSVQWSADGDTMLAANTNNTPEGTFYNIVVIDPITGERLRVYEGFLNRLSSAYWSPDETQIVATSIDGTAYLVDAASGAITPIFSSDVPLLSAAWSPYAGQVAIGAPPGADTAPALRDAEGNLIAVPVHILVPDPSLERLTQIANLCIDAPAARDDLLTGLTERTLDTFVGQVRADAAIPPGCAADLIAVAEAIR